MDLTNRFHSHKLHILKTIGKGTYGNVYLCENHQNTVLSIVKDIELNGKIQDHKQDIANEVSILSSLKHPNIIRFYECFYTDNHVMISMEYASSGNLAEYMYQRYPKLITQQAMRKTNNLFNDDLEVEVTVVVRMTSVTVNQIRHRGSMNLLLLLVVVGNIHMGPEILFFFSQILLGVNYIHTLNVIHRDLKAENILLTGKNGVLVKIGDFGISKMLSSAKKTSTVIGTPYYLAPELCEGHLYDTKSDIWALGCLLYEMCTHKRAFDAESLVGLVKVITNGSVHPIDLTIYERGMQDLIDAMLSILPDKRPTVKDLMGRVILLPIIYSNLLDAGDEELLSKEADKFRTVS